MQGVFLAGRMLCPSVHARVCVCVCVHEGMNAHSVVEEMAKNIKSKGQ